ncbi:MAG: PAS domain S-box protein [Chloroflexi bacterium]|nr:PAS domain S-box protein [Chloroflexota bacterium]
MTEDIVRQPKSGWFATLTHQLRAYHPRWHDRRFWRLQILVILLTGFHIVLDAGGFHDRLELLYFLPVGLLLVPVVYAALTYGFVGAIATALWVTVLTIPDVILWHSSLERWGVIAELVLLSGVASFIGQKVDRERRLLEHAEAVATALEASTMKYHGLLESSPIAVLVVDRNGAILEANSAACILFGKDTKTVQSMRVADLLGAAEAQKLVGNSRAKSAEVLTVNLNGRALYLEPKITESDDGKGNPVIQILLRDITEEYQRRAGLRAFAGEVLRALEEDRQLMARELHDQTVQTLILLVRQLDNMEESRDSLPPFLVDKLRTARETAEGVVKDLRDFAKSLRPPILDDLGLTVSIRRQLSDFSERTKIESQLVVTGRDRRLPSETELGIFRITQEALRNVERHADATYVAVFISFTEQGVTLNVIDNGVGFAMPPSSDFTASGHLGLISMQERAQLLGGKLEIQSSPGKGAKVTFSVSDTAKTEIPDRRLEI